MSTVHIVPGDDPDHTTGGVDCWCCPVYTAADRTTAGKFVEVNRDCAVFCQEHKIALVITHRSVIPELNDATGPIPWMP